MTQRMRCDWGNTPNETYQTYHDQEWGKLNLNNQYLYEMLVLESFQSGLSWETILNKRENFRQDFIDFDYHKVAKFTDKDFATLMQDKGIIRNRRKIEAAINNAQVLVKLEEEGSSFKDFLLPYISQPIINHPHTMADVPAKSELSIQLSKAMKKMGFKFVGPVTIYSFLQAVGLVNDYIEECYYKYQ